MTKKLLLILGVGAFIAAVGTPANAGPTDAQKCAGSLRKCMGKYFAAIVKCHAKAALTEGDVTDQACVDTATSKWSDCTGKALAKGGCLTDQIGLDHLGLDEIRDAWTADVKDDTPAQ